MTSQLWADWGALTRFIESGRIAFEREAALWGTLQLADRHGAKVESPAGQGRYSVALDDHIATVRDLTVFYASALIHSYALAESAACTHLAIDTRSAGGIENWGTTLLTNNGRKWGDVFGNRPGAVEVAVCRNAFAHGAHVIDANVAARLALAGSSQWSIGDTVLLSYEDLRLFRDRLRSLLRIGGL